MSNEPKRDGWPNVGAAIRKARKDKKLSQEELAAKVGLSGPGLSRIETGGRLNIGMLRRIARALETEGYLLIAYAEELDALEGGKAREPNENQDQAPR